MMMLIYQSPVEDIQSTPFLGTVGDCINLSSASRTCYSHNPMVRFINQPQRCSSEGALPSLRWDTTLRSSRCTHTLPVCTPFRTGCYSHLQIKGTFHSLLHASAEAVRQGNRRVYLPPAWQLVSDCTHRVVTLLDPVEN